MIDLVKLHLQAGKGGDGRVSFHRAKYITKGGPDGGDGGDGGNIYLVGNKNHNTLQIFSGKTAFAAEAGDEGGAQKSFGRKGEDLYLEVPVGTVVWKIEEDSKVDKSVPDNDENFDQELAVSRHQEVSKTKLQDVAKTKVAEILEEGQQILLCKGGKGGRGNERFKSSVNVTPMESEKGQPGEAMHVFFELKLLADVGLVGFPNAGKSTFLSLVTKANPRIANYPFTTIEPNLGVMDMSGSQSGSWNQGQREVVIADIPGLIEGANTGKGLGIQFLRHIERCKALMFVLYLEETIIYDDEKTVSDKVEELWSQFTSLRDELTGYDESLAALPFMVTVNKVDLYDEDLQTAITEFFAEKKQPVTLWSGATQVGIDQVKSRIQKLLT